MDIYIRRLLWTCGLMACAITAWAQNEQALSHQMKVAIQFYEQGDDLKAMDQFMELVTAGDPSERVMANEYLNRLAYRMNPSATPPPAPAAAMSAPAPVLSPAPVVAVERAAPAPNPDAPATPMATQVEIPPVAAPSPAPSVHPWVETPEPHAAPMPAQTPAAPAATVAEPPLAREAAQKESQARLRLMQENSLQELQACDGLRIVKNESNELRAIGIPSAMLFSTGVSLHKGSGKILDALTRLLYSLGRAQVFILPEGTVIGDAKVLDMRRAMGISSYLLQAGLAAPRVRVNLLTNQVDIPKPLQNFMGILIVFIYDRPMRLAVENSLEDEAGGPPITLGAYPTAFRPDKNESVFIELSISEPPGGLLSWRFQMLPPRSGAAQPAPLQEALGSGPAFHQIGWNGRLHNVGAILPAGRYECVLSATDAKNRTRTLHRWIELLGPAAAKTPVFIKESRTPAKVRIAPKKAKASHRQKPHPKAKAAKSKKVTSAPRAFSIVFQADSHQMTRSGEKTLVAVAAALSAHASEDLILKGYAHSSEPDAETLAQRRAQMVAGLFINKYQVEPKRVQIQSAVSEDVADRRVELRFEAKER